MPAQMELHSAGDDVPHSLRVRIPEGKPGGALGTVLERSRQLSLTRYNKPLFREGDYLETLDNLRQPVVLTKPQQQAFAALFKWRDTEARRRDESHEYILPKCQMLTIAKEQPTTSKELKAALQGNRTPSMVAALAQDILEVVAGTLREGSPEPATATAPSTVVPLAKPSKPAPAISFWKGPELHTGLRPQPARDATEAVAVNVGAAETKERSENTSGAAVPLVVNEANGNAGNVDGRSPDPMPELRTVQVKPLRSATTSALGLTMKGKADPRKAQPSSLASALGKAPSSQIGTAAETAQNIRNTFFVPFPSMPAAAEEPKAPDPATDAPRPTSGAEIRAVANKLREEAGQPGKADPQAPEAAKPLQILGDFLPISELRKRKREPAKVGFEDSDIEDGKTSGTESEPRNGDNEKVDAVTEEAGLRSTSDSDLESGEQQAEDEESLETSGSDSAHTDQPAKRRKSLLDGKGEALEPFSRGTQGGGANWGAVGRRKSTQADGRGVEIASAKAVLPFDYSAARAATPGLDLQLDMQHGRGHAPATRPGRGRRGGGRRGRGPSDKRPSDPFNVYQLDESKFIRGGKRTAVMPRSGNKSATFR